MITETDQKLLSQATITLMHDNANCVLRAYRSPLYTDCYAIRLQQSSKVIFWLVIPQQEKVYAEFIINKLIDICERFAVGLLKDAKTF